MSDKPSSDDVRNLRSSLEMIRFELRRLERRLETLEESAAESDASSTRPVEVPPSIEPPPISSTPITPPPVINPPPPRYQTLDALRKVQGLPPVSIEPNVKTDTSAGMDAGEFEIAIGKTWLNRVGAFILLLGIGFFIKYAFDRGFISPTMRVLIGAGIGLLLIAGGEYSIRKGMRQFAAGLLGAGSATLYFSTYAAHTFYELMGTRSTFGCLCAVTALSTIMSVRGNLLGIAILGLVGGLWTPLAVSTGRNEQVALLTYLIILDVGFLTCGLIRRWHVLRLLTFVGTLVLFFGWYDKFYTPNALWVTLGFIAAFYAIYMAEGQIAVRRPDAGDLSIPTLITSLANAAFFGSVYFLAHESLDKWLGLFAVSMGALQFVLAMLLSKRGDGSTLMADSLQIAGASFLALAAPLQFDRQVVAVSWGIQSVVTLGFCRKHERPWLRIKSCSILVAALCHLFLFEFDKPDLNKSVFSYGHWYITRILALFAFLGLCGYAGALVLALRRTISKTDAAICTGLIVLGTAVLLGDFWHYYERYLATWWWVGLAMCWYLAARFHPSLSPFSLTILVACVCKYFLVDTFWSAGFDSSWSQINGICHNRMFMTGVLMACIALFTIPRAAEYLGGLTPGSFWHEFLLGDRMVAPLSILFPFTILWAGSFEIARVFRFEPWRDTFSAPILVGNVVLTGWWVLNTVALWIGVGTRRTSLALYALVLSWWCAAWFVLHETIQLAIMDRWSTLHGVAINRTFILGIGVIANTFLAYSIRKRSVMKATGVSVSPVDASALLLVATGLTVWLPTFEILRVFTFEPVRTKFADPKLAMQVFLSVLWAVAAIVYLGIGFARMVALLRYLAIALFGMTICKVMLVDMANLDMIYRIVSFIVLGVLLLAASLLYQKLSERILKHAQA